MSFTVNNAINMNARTLARMGPNIYPYLCSTHKEELLRKEVV